MEREPIEVVRALMDAVAVGDVEAIEAVAADDLVFHSTFAASEGRMFSGPTAVRDYFDAVGEAFDEVVIEPVRFVDAVDDRVLIHARVRGRGRGSGLTLDHVYGQVYTVRDGLITTIESHMDPADAERAFRGGD